jgi:hypothetical protein
MSKRLIVLVVVLVLPLLPVSLLIRQSSSGLSSGTERAARLSPVSSAQLRDLTAGTEVVLEGTVDARTPVHYQSLVAYEQQYSLVDNDLGRYWRTLDHATPPLWITLADGQSVQIVNDGYQLRHTTTTVDGSVNSYGRPTRYLGLQAGERVTVLGRVANSTAGLAVEAAVVAGGSRAEWLADEHGFSAATLDGVLIAGLAVSVVGLGAWWLTQRRGQPTLPAGV